MPTGYTSALYEGTDQTFEEFAWECARAFGALISLRDSPRAEIPNEIEPSDYHKRRAEEARGLLQVALSWSDERADTAAQAEYNEALARHHQSVARRDATIERYKAMLENVERWTPPTSEHEGLKAFMAEQLRSSIDFDDFTMPPPVNKSGREHRNDTVAAARRDIAYHEKKYAEEVERARERTEWLHALRSSLTKLSR